MEKTIGIFNLKQLKEQFGTPLYIYDESIIINNINTFKNNFKHEHLNGNIVYAGKAFLSLKMAKLIDDHNLYLDCVSRGELYTAIKAGFNPEKIVLHGNNKTKDELIEALNYKVGMIILDNLYEAKLLMEINNKKYIPKVMLRANLSFDVNTHKYILTSNEDSKFGVSINDEAIKIIKELINDSSINFVGLHSHMGSQILDEDYFYKHASLLLDVYKRLKEEHDITFSEINIGGGFGIKYLESDKPLNYEHLLKELINLVYDLSNKNNLKLKNVYIEPGRSIVGNAGYTLYTVNQIKKTPHFNYLFVDGSMNDNLRTALYQAKYDALVDGKENDERIINYKVAGKACESGDILIDNILLPKVVENDLLLVKSTGAYHYSMANNYNRLFIPPVIFIDNNKIKVVVRKQTLDDLIRYDEEI